MIAEKLERLIVVITLEIRAGGIVLNTVQTGLSVGIAGSVAVAVTRVVLAKVVGNGTVVDIGTALAVTMCYAIIVKSLQARENDARKLIHDARELVEKATSSNTEKDGFSLYVCHMCTRRIQYLENASADLKAFRDLAHSSLRHMQSRGPMKRTRVTAGEVGVSPDTAKVRHQAQNWQGRSYLLTVIHQHHN